jgi:hypothetical protein
MREDIMLNRRAMMSGIGGGRRRLGGRAARKLGGGALDREDPGHRSTL